MHATTVRVSDLIDTPPGLRQTPAFQMEDCLHGAAMEFLRQLILYSILIASFWGGILLIKSFSSKSVPPGYSDVSGLPEFGSYSVDQTVRFQDYRAGDALCFRLGESDDLAVNFAWVVGLPGDSIAVKSGQITVNGMPTERGSALSMNDCGPIQVPRDHVYVLSDKHQRDSIAQGPLPAAAIIGRIGSLP
jgi:hypothetical protein